MIHFSCPVVLKQTDFTASLLILVLNTMSFQTDVLPIAITLEKGYLYLIESLQSIHNKLAVILLFYDVAKNHYNAWNCWRTHCSPQKQESSCREVFCKKGVHKNFTKFTGKLLCQSLFFNKVAGLRPTILLKKTLWHRCFLVNFEKFLRTPFFIDYLWWLLLKRDFLLPITLTLVKLFCLGHDKFPRDRQSIGSPVIKPCPTNLLPSHSRW